MADVEFRPEAREHDSAIPSAVNVYLDGRLTGQIRPQNPGWKYFPKNSKVGGEVFETLVECEHSLIGD